MVLVIAAAGLEGFEEAFEVGEAVAVGGVAELLAKRGVSKGFATDDERDVVVAAGGADIGELAGELVAGAEPGDAEPEELGAHRLDRVDERRHRVVGAERLGAPAVLAERELDERDGQAVGVADDGAADGERGVGGGRLEGGGEAVESAEHDLGAAVLLVDLNVAGFPAVADLTEGGADDLVADGGDGVVGEVEVEEDGADVLLVAGDERFAEAGDGAVEDGLGLAGGGGQAEGLGGDDLVLAGADKLDDGGERDAPVAAGGPLGGDELAVAPAFERGFADADGAGNLLGRKQFSHHDR